jgi:MFS family permease
VSKKFPGRSKPKHDDDLYQDNAFKRTWLKLNQSQVTRAFQYPEFRGVWTTAVLAGLANSIERLSVGWFILEQTNSVLLTALSFALRNLPNLVFGPLGGAAADSFKRSRLLKITLGGKGLILATLALLLMTGRSPVELVLGLVLLLGIGFTFEVPTTQALITDSVPPELTANSIALYSVGTRAISLVGAIVSGVLLEQVGAQGAFLVAATALGLGSLALKDIQPQTVAIALPWRAVFSTAREGLIAMGRLPTVRILLILTILLEILAYSYQSLLPSIARDVLKVGATGLGTLSFGAGMGSLIGSITLSCWGNIRRKGIALLLVTSTYGLFLIAFSLSPWFSLSGLLIIGVGAMASLFDALQWITLQHHVPSDMKGRVIGGWLFATGFGWLGHMVLGALAELVGVQTALGLSGILVVVLGVGLLAFSAQLRQA